MLDFEQYVDIFIDESKEHLQSLNQCLLNFEENRENLETVNEIFRIAHTLKGMSATMGFEVIASLTHKMENILDGIRGQKLYAEQEIVDILFEGLDILEEQIKAIESEGKEKSIDISDIIKRLEIIEKGGVSAKKESQSEPLTIDNTAGISISSEDLETIKSVAGEMSEKGFKIHSLKIELEPNCMLKAARAFLVFKSLEENGEIVYSDPSSDDIEDEKFESSFTLLFSSTLPQEDIEKLIMDVSEVKSVVIAEYDINTSKVSQEINVSNEQEIINEVNNIEKNETSPEENEGKEKTEKKNKAAKTVRVDIDRLDNLMNLVSELIIVKTRLEDDEISSDEQSMGEAVEYLERITTSLHDAVTKVRMVPVERVFNRFPRMIRDLSKDLNKEIELHMSGEETEVDRTVIDEIGDPLIHLLRNSIDHGIETPEKRLEKGKSEKGRVNLIAYPDGNTVVIEVSDDGAGINVEKVKQIAISREIITSEQAKELDINRAAELIFEPGFSTADKISDISGRGVGLDVVKTKIEALGGNVEIETETDKGSKFIIRLPLTLAIIQALLVIVGGEKYAIPLNNIKEITSIDTKGIRLVEKKEVVLYRGNTLPLVRLSEELMCAEVKELEDEATVVIVKKGEREIGLIVDNLIGQQEIVIKSLGKYLSFINQIAGATILGNGGVALIIDTNSLF
ncbi:two-component system chemotaxis sensor kinase CheA [Acetoanaerobium pronyense]|uniref:Chemotaxis protein CheA n=1 Tax=Acetoanaerobium pronyense TaxID=1482736 RepID=A0ABS4KF80_9FIRM|nr:two-component system chemotaxis sensor kinase CheA [Acetoanaerobium pronyense]